DLEPGAIEKGGGTNGYASFIALNHAKHWGIVAWTNVNDDDFQQVVAHAVSPRTARMPVLWSLVQREPSPLSGIYRLSKGAALTLDVFKYKGDMYVWVSNATPFKLTRLGGERYAFDPLHLTLAFNLDDRGRATGLTAVQNGRAFRMKRVL
ncbi:MAG: hypothetical protein JO165_03415, partial [Candidatus Eremiobacteraeota bacterium]|nr:hypothetical protein [Candidatus Eremiobacteraeota bacterium]